MSARTLFVLRRLLLTVPVLLVMSAVVFLIVRLVPGDPARTILGFRATPETLAQVRAQLHLDDSLWQQYLSFLSDLLHGNLGRDFVSRASLNDLLAQRLPVTLELTVAAMLLALAVGIPAGVLAASRGGWWRLSDQHAAHSPGVGLSRRSWSAWGRGREI